MNYKTWTQKGKMSNQKKLQIYGSQFEKINHLSCKRFIIYLKDLNQFKNFLFFLNLIIM
jgi:hypothetical protein